MKLKILLAFRISRRLTREARWYRRALRDNLREETARIRNLEIRSRGLRLYAAWASGVLNVIQTRAENWYQTMLADAAVGDQSKNTGCLAGDLMSSEIQTYADLQKMIRKALREQHPEWVDANEKCPLCDSYEARFAYLVDVFALAKTLRVPLTSTHGIFNPEPELERNSNDHLQLR